MADPIQGLIDFVLAQKPYHTKILDTLVNYTHEDEVDVEFIESQLFEIGMIITAEFSDSSGTPESIIETCPNGWGDTFDQPGQFLVVYGDDATDIVYVVGDATASFTAGVSFEIRDPDDIDPDLLYTVDTDATYDAVTDRTAIPIVEDILGGDFIVVAPPVGNDDTVGNVFPIYSVVSTTIIGNVIVLSGVGINIDDFHPGYSITIRNAGEAALNKDYRIVASVESGLNEVTVFCSDNVLADTVADGEAVFAGFGYDEPPWCASSEQTVVRPIIAETLDIETLQEPGATPSFQYFILEADSGANTFTVEGDVRDDIAPTDDIDVVHAIDPGFVDFYSTVLGANNGTHTVATVAYDPVTNRSVIGVGATVTDSQPTGFIIPN